MSFKSRLDVTNRLYIFKIIENRLVEKGIIKTNNTMAKEITLKKHTDDGTNIIVKIKQI